MAVNRNDEFENRFDSGAVDLDNPNINVPLGSLSEEVGEAERLAVQESVTPDEVDPSKANIIDEQNQAEISLNLDPLPLSGFEKTGAEVEDPKSLADMLQSKFKSFNVYGGTPPSTVDASYDPLSLALEQADKIDLSGTKTDAIEEAVKEGEEVFGADAYVPDTGLGTLASEGYDYAKGKLNNLYESYFGDPYAGQNTVTTSTPYGPSPVGGAALFGSGVNLATYATPFATSLAGQAGANLASQASIGLSSAPPASLAGQGANFGTVAKSSTWATLGNAASVYGIYDGIKNKDYFSAGTSLITLLNPATAVPIAILHAAKFALSHLFGGNSPKPKFGGVDLKASSNKLMTTRGYGYNAYRRETGQAVGASIADYVNQYVKDFGLQFNGNRWQKFLQENPRLERYDSTGETGYSDPSTMIRAILETEGMVTGTPTYNGQPITSQEDYKAKMEDFNKRYQDMAYKNGGLVDPVSVGINTPLSGEFTTVQTKKDTGVPDPNSPLDYSGRHTQNIVSFGERPATLFEMLHKNLTGSYTI